MSAADNVFGVGHRVHPVTKRPLESGIGCLSDDQQAGLHLLQIEQEEGVEAAEEMRKKLAKAAQPAKAAKGGK